MTLNSTQHEELIESREETLKEINEALSLLKSIYEYEDNKDTTEESEDQDDWSDNEWEVIKAYFENEQEDEEERKLMLMCINSS
ncbi:hypothetical protein CU097_002833 [Rhizopus azygosporus]|uniref:Uncharacterized protein n=1 Tax=Rhizopus azygosporus TaxID=86630 RepID=A0A367IYY7_RHIAZ|nr:hypothetical protein CU097_002833 [Rhizopus azygosporus]